MEKLDTVMLIEDDVITNYINSRLIQNLKISDHIEVKKTGSEALQYLDWKLDNAMPCPELILLDINMPEMNGLEFLIEFRKMNFSNKNKVEVILLTTYSHIRDYDQFIQLDIHSFLIKPLTKNQLIPMLKKFFCMEVKLV